MSAVERAHDAKTYLDGARSLLGRLAVNLRLPSAAGRMMTREYGRLLGPLAGREIPARPPWPSAISDDASPYEFSLVLDERPEVRVLWESQGDSGDLRTKMAAALATQERLCRGLGAASARFDAISDLFLPSDPQGAFVLWHAARLWPMDGAHELKAYFNPQVRGRLRAAALVEEALARLGFTDSWKWVAAAMSRGPELDEIRYLSLDLWDGDAARIKVYVYHRNPTPDALRAAASTSPHADPERVLSFYRAVTADRDPVAGFCPGSCLSFASEAGARPTAVTLHVPVRGYARHDREVDDRIAELASSTRPFVTATGKSMHRGAVDALSKRSPDAGVGLTTYVSLRSQQSSERVTCYLATETFETQAPRAEQARPTRPTIQPVEAMVERYESEPLTLHPFFQRMTREPIDVRHLWLLFRNIYLGLSQHFPRRLAHVVASVDDERIRCLLAKQLHEEMGAGDVARAHRRLFLELLDTLSPWKPATVTPEMEAPSKQQSQRLEAIYFDAHPYTGVGASIVIELLGKQVDLFCAEQFRRQQAVGLASLEWLTLHEALELDHANESLVLATFVERDKDRQAAWRGGREVYDTGWAFCDEMYNLCFGS